MNVFHLTALLALCFFAVTSLTHGEDKPPKEVESLLRDFRSDFAKAKEPSDKVLQAEGSKIVSKLIRDGRTDDANLVAEQVKKKLSGSRVADSHSEVLKLFESYDKAVESGTKSTRDRYLGRTDSLIRFYEGKNMQAILALAGVRKEVLGDVPAKPILTEAELKESILGKYTFQVGGYKMKRELLKDGTIKADIAGTWKIEKQKLRVDYSNGAWVEFDLSQTEGKLTGKTNRNEVLTAEKVPE